MFATSISLVVTSTLSVCLLADGEGVAPPLFWLGVALVVCATLAFEGRKLLLPLLAPRLAAAKAATAGIAGKPAPARCTAPIDAVKGGQRAGTLGTFGRLRDADAEDAEAAELATTRPPACGSAVLDAVKGVKPRSRSSFDRLRDVEAAELGAEETGCCAEADGAEAEAPGGTESSELETTRRHTLKAPPDCDSSTV